MTRATLYDGTNAYAHHVTVSTLGDRLQLVTDGGHGEEVAPGLLTRDGEGHDWRFARSDRPGWRLRFEGEPSADVAALLPRAARYGGFIDRFGLGKAALVLAGVAGAVLFVGYSAPQWIAPHVPQSWERNLGTAIVGDFGTNRLRDPKLQAALEKLAERVEPGATSGPQAISFAALDLDMVNAAALPGRHVIFFEGMLKKACSADELAGVMAHEIAHVRRRHVTESLLRELGIGALIRLFAGGVGANAQQLVGLQYTRANEAEADADAIRMLAAAGIDPRPTAALFRKLDPAAAKGRRRFEVEWLESHPGIAGRAARFAAAFRPNASYRPALTATEAKDLRTNCSPWIKRIHYQRGAKGRWITTFEVSDGRGGTKRIPAPPNFPPPQTPSPPPPPANP